MTQEETTLQDLVGIEHSKLGFFQELRQKLEELKKLHGESEDQRREISAILDGITDVMMVLDEDLRIISVNHVFEELFPGDNPVGRFCYELFRDEDHPCPECPAFRSLSTDSVCKETAIFRLGGRNMQFEMVASPLKNPAWSKHRVLIFKRDVTMEKEYQAKFYLAEKMATIGMLAAGVAHEVNNPLAAVAGFAEGIRRRLSRLDDTVDGEVLQDMREYTDIILKECHRCHDIVKSLLSFSRTKPSFTRLALNRLVGDTARLIQHQMKNREELVLELDLDPTLPVIHGDEPQLKQVILNLLTNAADAIGDVGRIRVRTFADAERICLEVKDTGCGIAPENLDKLFEPFYTTKPVGRGIGIGLATCYTIVKEHGGAITVNSAQGKGSTFTVELPAEPPADPESER